VALSTITLKLTLSNQKHITICVGHHYMQITQIRHEPSEDQLEGKTNRTSFHVEIVTKITTRNSEQNRTTPKTK